MVKIFHTNTNLNNVSTDLSSQIFLVVHVQTCNGEHKFRLYNVRKTHFKVSSSYHQCFEIYMLIQVAEELAKQMHANILDHKESHQCIFYTITVQDLQSSTLSMC